MEAGAILLRDQSEDSEKAEKFLKKSGIRFTALFSSHSEKLPCVISAKSSYSYEGMEGILRYIRITTKDN